MHIIMKSMTVKRDSSKSSNTNKTERFTFPGIYSSRKATFLYIRGKQKFRFLKRNRFSAALLRRGKRHSFDGRVRNEESGSFQGRPIPRRPDLIITRIISDFI